MRAIVRGIYAADVCAIMLSVMAVDAGVTTARVVALIVTVAISLFFVWADRMAYRRWAARQGERRHMSR